MDVAELFLTWFDRFFDSAVSFGLVMSRIAARFSHEGGESGHMIRIASMSGSVVVLAVTVVQPNIRHRRAQSAPGADLQRSALQIASAHGKEVRVTSMNGAKRKGRLVSLSTSEVVSARTATTCPWL